MERKTIAQVISELSKKVSETLPEQEQKLPSVFYRPDLKHIKPENYDAEWEAEETEPTQCFAPYDEYSRMKQLPKSKPFSRPFPVGDVCDHELAKSAQH